MNKLSDQYNNTFHHFINKNCINVDYSALNKTIEVNLLALKLKANDRVSITECKNILNKGYTKKIGQEKYLGSLYEKKLLFSQLERSYYPELDSHIRDEVNVVLD